MNVKCKFGVNVLNIYSVIVLDSPSNFVGTITDSPTELKTAKTASLDDYLLISGIVLAAIGIVVLSFYLWKAKTARAKYNVNRNNQTNRQETNA